MQHISVRLQQINATDTNNYTCYKTIWWQSQMPDWVHPHQHGTILYTYYTVWSYFQPGQAYGMNSTHVRLMKVSLWQLFFLILLFSHVSRFYCPDVSSLRKVGPWCRKSRRWVQSNGSESSWYMRNWRNTKVARNYYRNQQATGTNLLQCWNHIDSFFS